MTATKLTRADVIGQIREAGCSARYDAASGEYRVALPRGCVVDPEASAYYTTDAEDAVATAARMVAEHNAAVDARRAHRATRPLYLVACVAEKADAPCAARELYRSDWFRKARAYVEAMGVEWRILSAEHGLVDPGQELAPYDRTLTKMGKAERKAWAERVVEQLRDAGLAGRPVVFLAGERYRDPFLVWWLQLGAPVSVPMEGLGLGEQKAWLARAAAEAVEDTRREIVRVFRETIDDAEAELDRGPTPGRFNLVTEDLMAVVRAPGGGYRLGTLTGDRVLTAEGRMHAEDLARRWNNALTADQVAARCSVRVLSRFEALEALIDQTRRLLDQARARD